MPLHIVTAPDDGSTDTQRAPPSRRGHADKALIHGHTSHATTCPRRPLHTPFRRGIGHRAGRDHSPLLHPWLCRARSAAASSSQLQPRGERLVCPESKRAAGWVENRSEVVGRRVRIKGVIGAGVSGSKGERPGTVNVQRVAAAVSRLIFKYYLRIGHERDGGERNDRNGKREDRETPRGRKNGGRAWWSREAARARSSSATHSRRQQRGVGWLPPFME